jgi:Uma2 family endonuclease
MGNVRTLLTFGEFERMPEQPGKQELIRGELIELPPAKLKHDRIGRRFFKWLDAVLAEMKVEGVRKSFGEVCIETGYKMPNNGWYIPDVSITHARQIEGEYFEGSPALAIEIVSESNTAKAIGTKVQDYLAFGALQVWVVYPERRQMFIHQPGAPAEMFSGRFPLTLLPGIELDLHQILGE